MPKDNSFTRFIAGIDTSGETFGHRETRVRKTVMREIVSPLLDEFNVSNPETFLHRMEQEIEFRDTEFNNRG